MKGIPLFKVYMSERAPEEVEKTLRSGYIGEGPKVKELEKNLSHRFGATTPFTDIVTVNSATSGEILLYSYLKKARNFKKYFQFGSFDVNWEEFGKEDHVLTTPLTFIGTNTPIVLSGLNLKWVDVDSLTLNMSLEDLEYKINEHTRIVTFVHWAGNPVDLDRVHQIVGRAMKKYGRSILVIEDCAHAFGSKYKGDYVGFTGNLATFSLQAIKHITSVDGGFIVTPYLEMGKELRKLRWYGIDRDDPYASYRSEGDISEIGSKYHMNDVCATIGLCNLAEADSVLSRYKENGFFYDKMLVNTPGIKLIPQVDGGESAYWVYSLHVANRDDFMRYMGEKGIVVSKVHERNDKHSSLAQYKTPLPGLEKAIETMCCIPSGYWVGQEEREYIVDAIKGGW